jgi:hypothetical protein
MNPATQCITAADPTFIASMGTGVGLALGLGALLLWVDRRRAAAPLSAPLRNGLWFGALAASFAAPIVLLGRLFAWRYPGATLCTSLIWPWFFVPPAVLFLAAFFGPRLSAAAPNDTTRT